MKAQKSIYILVFIAAIVLSQGCHKKQKPAELKFCLTDTMLTLIKLDTVKYQDVKNEMTLNGKISFDQEKVIKIYPLTGGYVEEIFVELGDSVKKGQTLAIIASGDIVNLKKELFAAEEDLLIAERNLSAAKDLLKGGMTSQKEYVTTEKEYNKSRSEVARIQAILKLYGVHDDQPHYYIKSPISGFLVEKKVNANTQIRADNNDYLFTISDLRDVWVLANVYESDIDKVSVNFPVTVTTIPYPDKVFNGKIDRIYNMLDPETRSLKVRIKLDNPDYRLKPEMYANVFVSHIEKKKMLAIPSSATIFDNGKNYVMVYHDKCNISTQEVVVARSAGGVSYISDGALQEGDKIIIKYQLEIYDALND
jgi:cobalt-zinc-cadmium efflux system membrane fusion protein